MREFVEVWGYVTKTNRKRNRKPFKVRYSRHHRRKVKQNIHNENLPKRFLDPYLVA